MKIEQMELPPDWEWTTMGEIADVVGGGTPKTSDLANYEGGEIPWLTPADLSGYTAKTISHGGRRITQKGFDTSSAKMMPAGSVLFTSRAPIGYVAIASNPVCTNQGFKSFVLKKGILPDYVYWWLKGSKSLAESMASGTTFLELSGAKAKQLPIPVAPLDQQKRIVAEIEKQFSRLDEAVANLKRVKANLKRYKAAVLKAAVEGRLVETEAERARSEGRSYETGEQLLQRILETRRRQWKGKGKYKEPAAPDTTDLPELPEGWCCMALSRFSALENGDRSKNYPSRSAFVEQGVPFINAGHLGDGRIDMSEMNFISEDCYSMLRAGKVRENDVLFCLRGSLGKAAIVRNVRQGAIASSLVIVRPCEDLRPEYLLLYLMSALAQDQIQLYDNGSAQPNLSAADLGRFVVPIPPIVDQQRIIAEVERRLTLLRETEAQVDTNLQRAERLRQSILARAFSGQLVAQDGYPEAA